MPDGEKRHETATVHHKGWAHYEFGKLANNMPGNCGQCREKYRANAEGRKKQHQYMRRNLLLSAQPVPAQQELDPNPPCQKCPKWKLFPDNFGLDPKNETTVQLYRIASGERHRIGTFAGAFLAATVSISDVRGVLDEYGDLFPTPLHRRRTFEAIMALDRIATQVRGEAEEAERKRAEEKQKAEANRKKP